MKQPPVHLESLRQQDEDRLSSLGRGQPLNGATELRGHLPFPAAGPLPENAPGELPFQQADPGPQHVGCVPDERGEMGARHQAQHEGQHDRPVELLEGPAARGTGPRLGRAVERPVVAARVRDQIVPQKDRHHHEVEPLPRERPLGREDVVRGGVPAHAGVAHRDRAAEAGGQALLEQAGERLLVRHSERFHERVPEEEHSGVGFDPACLPDSKAVLIRENVHPAIAQVGPGAQVRQPLETDGVSRAVDGSQVAELLGAEPAHREFAESEADRDGHREERKIPRPREKAERSLAIRRRGGLPGPGFEANLGRAVG